MENSNEIQEPTQEQLDAAIEEARKASAKPMSLAEVKQLPVKGGQRFKPQPTKADLVRAFENKIGSLESMQRGMIESMQRNVTVIKQLSEKLEEFQFTISAFHNLFQAKNIFKEDELKAEVERVVAEEDARRETEFDKRAGLQDKGVDAVIESGDVVIISYEGVLYGETQPFKGGVATKAVLPTGQGMMIPGFEEQLIGMKAGVTGVVDVQFPDTYRADLASQKAQFKVTIHKIKVAVKKTESTEKLPESPTEA